MTNVTTRDRFHTSATHPNPETQFQVFTTPTDHARIIATNVPEEFSIGCEKTSGLKYQGEEDPLNDIILRLWLNWLTIVGVGAGSLALRSFGAYLYISQVKWPLHVNPPTLIPMPPWNWNHKIIFQSLWKAESWKMSGRLDRWWRPCKADFMKNDPV